MPYNWDSIDNNFPTFTGRESPSQQIKALHDYLYQLREGLRYSLQNLTSDNFNAAAWENLTQAQKDEVTEQLLQMQNLLSQMSTTVESLRGDINDANRISGRVDDLEQVVTGKGGLQEQVTALEETVTGEEGLNTRVAKLDNRVGILAEAVAGEEGLNTNMAILVEAVLGEEGLLVEMEKLRGAVAVQEDESVTFGSQGKRIDLIGDIYINGVLYAQGEIQ